jgi:hypothetical protein
MSFGEAIIAAGARAPASRGGPRRGPLGWAGLACGLVCLGCSASAAGEHHRLYGEMPEAASITAYAAAICGAVLTVANTLFLVWDKVQERRHPRRKRHRPDDAPKAD